MRRAAAAFLLFTTFLAVIGRAQTSNTLSGRVVTAATGDPIRHALVTISQTGVDQPAALTDDKGQFMFRAVQPGAHMLSVTKAGYARTTTGVQSGADDVVVQMPKGAVISGTVLDESGEPVPQVSVMVETPPSPGHPLSLRKVLMTDERGEYRAAGLASGKVVVSVFAAATEIRLRPGGSYEIGGPGNPANRIYYPGVTDVAQAPTLDLQAGDEKIGINFTVRGRPPIGPPPRSYEEIEKNAASISGRILRPDGRPIRGAVVRLMPGPSTELPMRLASSDETGLYRFVLPEGASGRFRIAASRWPDFSDAEFGQRRPGDPGEDISVSAGERREHVDLTLPRGGSIAGRLFDEFGDPVEGAAMRALQVRYVDGRRRLLELAPFSAPTDDLGRYRLASLDAGAYLVSANIGRVSVTEAQADLPGYGTTYFPGTPVPAEAQRLMLGASQDMFGIDFPLAHLATSHVAGQAFDAAGDPITGGIGLTPSRRSGSAVATQLGARIERDGRFEFPNVPPGEYVLQATRHRASGWDEGESFTQFVTVTAVDIDGLDVRTLPGSTAKGRVVFEDGGSLVPGQLEIAAVPADSDLSPMIGGGPAHGVVDDDLTFQLAGLRGPRRLQLTRVPRGWALRAIRANGVDVTDTPLPFGRTEQSINDVEIVLTSHVTRFEGTVTESRRPASGATVLLFGENRDVWYPGSRFVRKVAATSDGAFAVEGVAPGDYYVAAVAALPGGRNSEEWQDPQYLETLALRARRVTFAEGALVTMSLNVTSR